jgi:allantoinase
MSSAEFVLRSKRVVTPAGERPATLKVRQGQIVEIRGYEANRGEANRGEANTGDVNRTEPIETEDLGELAILPGLVDPHVHLNEPGRTEWEGFCTGTAAAAAGGITTLVDMPLNSSPVTTSVAALQAKRDAAAGKLHVDVGFHAGLVPGSERSIAALIDAGVLGIKAFLCHSGIDEFPAATERELRAVMPLLAARGVPLLVHAEIESVVPKMSDPRCYADYLASRPATFERQAIEMLIDLCRETGCRTHIVHLADAGSLPKLRAAREEGLPLTVETCPHYLVFAAEEIPDGATPYKCAPPIRDTANREALWQGLRDGIIDFITTDHSPCPPEMKKLDEGRFDLAWGGISSLQIALPAVWQAASQRGHTLFEVVQWMSHRPAEFLGIPVGLHIGAPANLVILDPEAISVVRGADLLHRHPITPYDGRQLRGMVQRTYLRGNRPAEGEGSVL